MRDVGRGLGAWISVFSLLGGLGCGGSAGELWELLREQAQAHQGHSPPPPPPPPPIDARIDRDCLEQQLTPFVESIGAGWPEGFRPTGTVLVSAAGQQLYARGLGASDWELGSPNTVNTSFRVGSITKSFTAVAILQLVEAGVLALDDTIGEHLPEYPAVGAGITLHQLLSHTAGLPNYTSDAELMARRDQPITPAELLATFWAKPLEFEPGTQFRYSNSGYAVLGAVIERVAGLTYAQYMQRAVFAPAGLKRTTVGDAEGLADRALGYVADAHGRFVPAFPADMSVPFAAGAIRSTALDLARWHSVLGTDLLLSAESRELLTTPGLANYAYGWVISEQDGLEVVRHNGGIDGFLSDLVRVPELDLAVVVLFNAEVGSPELISNAALSCALGHDIPPQPPAPVVELDVAQRARLLGTYTISTEARELFASLGLPPDAIESLAVANVVEEAGDLLLALGGFETLMLPTSETEFILPATVETVRFSPGAAGAPATVLTLVAPGGLSFPYER